MPGLSTQKITAPDEVRAGGVLKTLPTTSEHPTTQQDPEVRDACFCDLGIGTAEFGHCWMTNSPKLVMQMSACKVQSSQIWEDGQTYNIIVS